MKNLTEIIFIIDKSGSMQNLVDDTIGGFNGFVENQKSLDGEAYLTTVLFSTDRVKLHDHIDIREVPAMDRKQYVASGMTAMLDAIGETIKEVQGRIDDTPVEERPENILCVITTDGQENSSHTYNKSTIQRMIEHQTKGHGWQFIFLGANMDAVEEASRIGIDMAATYTADSLGTKAVYDSINCAASSYRAMGVVDEAWASAVTDCTAVNKVSQ
jgi:uncharacterized protein YegL